MQKDMFSTEHLILSLFPDFALPITPTIPRQKYTLENLFLQNTSQWLLSKISYFLEREKQKQFFIPPLWLKSCNCIKNKILFIHNSEKNCSNLSFNFFNITNLYLFSTLYVYILQTSLIIKELISMKTNSIEKSFTIA